MTARLDARDSPPVDALHGPAVPRRPPAATCRPPRLPGELGGHRWWSPAAEPPRWRGRVRGRGLVRGPRELLTDRRRRPGWPCAAAAP
ncbi:hypothetical protein QJS66_08145 [Kocuria rhizophila]|nr:hypothetical protein QJS66_08145 [Kocuria rhizophila]